MGEPGRPRRLPDLEAGERMHRAGLGRSLLHARRQVVARTLSGASQPGAIMKKMFAMLGTLLGVSLIAWAVPAVPADGASAGAGARITTTAPDPQARVPSASARE